ncbi:MAG: iron-containing alcohol dehydrogenase [Synergistaceae bacterium]|jgi:alcohol dehydrogenase YqhD (iron-dependent ADH family)|nr:iron-containing alcohol dehydrogenase [Synergistaceae bacterium]
MNNFEFFAPTRIIYGRGTHREIGELLKPIAKKVLLHYGGGSVKKSGVYDAVVASLEASGIEFVELGGVAPNPKLSLVLEGVALSRRENVDAVLAVGGGSAIDSSKAIALGVCLDGDLWDIYESKASVERALPVVVILTIPAAGSESSEVSVITNEKKELKIGYHSPLIRPKLSVINPELFFTLPKNQIANGIADMMSHIFERYFTNTLHVDLTDSLCEATLRTIIKNGPALVENPRDYDAWAEIGFSATIAHNDILGVGREQDWASHRIQHQLSALYDIAHGAGLAVLTPFWMKYVYKDNVNMFAQFAVKVMGVDASFRDPEAVALAGIDRLSALFRGMNLPVTLRDLGIGEENLERMAKGATGESSGKEKPIGGLKKLYWQDALAIYKMAL